MGMPIISNDLRSSCRALLLQSHMSGGGGKKHDVIFHDILENIVPIIEHFDLGGGFTWTIGEWMSKPEYFGVHESGVQYSIRAINTGNRSFGYKIIYGSEILVTGIVYKNNSPLYAAVIERASDDNAYDQYTTWGITTGENTYRSVLYKSIGDHKIDSIDNVTYTKFEPDFSTMTTDGEEWISGFSLYYSTDLRYKYTHSYQRYKAFGDNYSEPTVVKDGDRTVTGGIHYVGSHLYPFPHFYGYYTDLDIGSMYKVMDELVNAIVEKAGGKIEPVKIIQPTE